MNNITSNYYIGLLEQCEIEQDIFESMLQYDYKLASLGSINESTISDIDAQYLTEASENIFKKIWNGIVALWHRIVELFNNIKNFLTKKKMQDQFQDTDKKINDITSSVSDDELDDILSSLEDIDIEESYILKEAEDSKGIYLYDLSEESMAGAFMRNNANPEEDLKNIQMMEKVITLVCALPIGPGFLPALINLMKGPIADIASKQFGKDNDFSDMLTVTVGDWKDGCDFVSPEQFKALLSKYNPNYTDDTKIIDLNIDLLCVLMTNAINEAMESSKHDEENRPFSTIFARDVFNMVLLPLEKELGDTKDCAKIYSAYMNTFKEESLHKVTSLTKKDLQEIQKVNVLLSKIYKSTETIYDKGTSLLEKISSKLTKLSEKAKTPEQSKLYLQLYKLIDNELNVGLNCEVQQYKLKFIMELNNNYSSLINKIYAKVKK